MRSLWCAARNDDFNFFYSVLTGRRPARLYCENSGRSGGIGASARSDRAQTAQILRDRSASAGVVTRYFSRCLIFWCFWIKPKAQKKENVQQKKSMLREFPARKSLPPFVTKRWRQKCPPGEKLRETHIVSLKRAPVVGLQANRPRFLTLVAARFFFRTFRNAECCALRVTMILISFTQF